MVVLRQLTGVGAATEDQAGVEANRRQGFRPRRGHAQDQGEHRGCRADFHGRNVTGVSAWMKAPKSLITS